MTRPQLERRVKFWQTKLAYLGVGHWRCHVSIADSDEISGKPGSSAAVSVSASYDTCYMEFRRKELESQDDRELDETIVHEWLHVAHRDFDEVLQGVSSWMPDATYTDWGERIDHEREGIIERLARTIVEMWYA